MASSPQPPTGQHDITPASTAATGKLIQNAIVLAIVAACALAGYDWWRKQHPRQAEARTVPAAEEPVHRTMYEQPAPVPMNVDREDVALDLGEGVKMEFVWIKPMNMWIGKYEVTNQEFRRYKPGHDTGTFAMHPMNLDRQPAVRISNGYEGDAQLFGQWMNEQCFTQLPHGYRVRLLTEDEAATILRCGDDRVYPWGSDWPPPTNWNYSGVESAGPLPRIEDHRDPWPVTCLVDESGRNDWGLYGVGDNVSEWTGTRHGNTLKRLTYGVAGGSWYFFGSKEILRSMCVSRISIKATTLYIGFRLALGR